MSEERKTAIDVEEEPMVEVTFTCPYCEERMIDLVYTRHLTANDLVECDYCFRLAYVGEV